MGSFIDLTGKRFGRLTVIERDKSKQDGLAFWVCKCDCGSYASIYGGNIRNGHTQSCGCLREETEAYRFLRHNATRKENPRLARIYKSMKHRCYRKEHNCYNNYGGRGIKICDEWLGDLGFENFVKWSKENGYADNLTIDRIDYNGHYSPQNCRWVSYKDNQNNRSDNRYIEFNGEVKTMSQWAEVFGIRPAELKRRLDYLGLPINAALSYYGVPKTDYKGKRKSITQIARQNGIDYRTFLHELFVNGKSAEEIVNENTRMKIQRMMDSM